MDHLQDPHLQTARQCSAAEGLGIASVAVPGDRILTASHDGTVRTRISDTDDLLEVAERRAIRDFTSQERGRYAGLLGEDGTASR